MSVKTGYDYKRKPSRLDEIEQAVQAFQRDNNELREVWNVLRLNADEIRQFAASARRLKLTLTYAEKLLELLQREREARAQDNEGTRLEEAFQKALAESGASAALSLLVPDDTPKTDEEKPK